MTNMTVTIDVDELNSAAVQHHVNHDDGTSTWRIEGPHDPHTTLYLTGTAEDLLRFSESIKAAVSRFASVA